MFYKNKWDVWENYEMIFRRCPNSNVKREPLLLDMELLELSLILFAMPSQVGWLVIFSLSPLRLFIFLQYPASNTNPYHINHSSFHRSGKGGGNGARGGKGRGRSGGRGS